MTSTVALTLLIVLVALVFDFTNGFHDAANSIATVVSTRVLSPRYAVMWAATFNFIAFAVFGTRVAKTIGGDLVRIDLIQQNQRLYVLCAGLLGAIIWNLITWYLGLPTSSSHALVGGYAGAAVAAYHGVSGLLKPEGWIKTLIFVVASPVIGFVMGFALMVTVYWIFHRWTPAQVDKTFRRGQLLSAAAYSLGHGGNDAQKTMGIITAVLAAAGIPVSTTHTITGAITGVGSTTRLSAVKWRVAGRIVWAWVLTIPAAAIFAAISFFIFELILAIVRKLT